MICLSKTTNGKSNARRSLLMFLCAFFVTPICSFCLSFYPITNTNEQFITANSNFNIVSSPITNFNGLYRNSFLHFTTTKSENDTADTAFADRFEQNINTVFQNKIFNGLYLAVPLLFESRIFRNKDINFRQIRNDLIPEFHYDYDTYLQFVPVSLTFALKSFGLTSHSSWAQLGLSAVLSYGLGYGLAKIMKENISELRPDWGGYKSFPSGHTTIAFISASVLSKEYKDEYPWLSVAGYTMAGVTGLSRVMNNRHWVHDVLFGSGWGILATELSYALTDCIFSNRKDSKFAPEYNEFKNTKPHYISYYLAYTHCLNDYPKQTARNMSYTVHSGSSFGIEGAYFFNKYFGISARVKSDGYWLDNKNIDWPADSVFSVQSFDVSPTLSYPLLHRIHLGIRAGVGLSHTGQKLIQYYIVLPKQTHLQYTCGIFADVWTDKHTYLRFYADLNRTLLDVDDKTQSFSTLCLGASIGLHF